MEIRNDNNKENDLEITENGGLVEGEQEEEEVYMKPEEQQHQTVAYALNISAHAQ